MQDFTTNSDIRVHSKTQTSVQLGILLGLSGDGMGGGGGGVRGDRIERVGERLCYALIQPIK